MALSLDGRKSECIAQEYRLVLPDFQSAGRVLLQLVRPLELWVMNSNSLIGRNCLNYAPLHKALRKALHNLFWPNFRHTWVRLLGKNSTIMHFLCINFIYAFTAVISLSDHKFCFYEEIHNFDRCDSLTQSWPLFLLRLGGFSQITLSIRKLPE